MKMESLKVLNDIITEKQLCNILNQNTKMYELDSYKISKACQGLSGFLGDHYKVTLYVKKENIAEQINLFVKTVPRMNKPKADFIHDNRYFLRESLMFNLIEEIGGAEGVNPWCTRAYVHNEGVMVMPDLSVEGYSQRPLHHYLDLDHVLVTVRAMAYFHAAIANNFTLKSNNEHQFNKLMEEIKDAIHEPTFHDSPWLRASAKLTVNFIKEYSSIYYQFDTNLEEEVINIYLKACDDLNERRETLNVLIHKDLWVNNIMFKYQDKIPINAILIDYQCIRYGPPAFDLLIFLYLTTSRRFREEHETKIINYYFSIFNACIDNQTKLRLVKLDYNQGSFSDLCEYARRFAMVEAISIFPYVLMDPDTAQATFDDPDTYYKYLNEDRSEPVIAHARRCGYYKERQLEAIEEFLERYVTKARATC